MSDVEEDVQAGEDEFAGLPEDEEEFVDEGEAADGDGDGDGDAEGEGEGEEGSAVDSSDEEEGSEQNEYEADGFVVDEDEGGEGEEDGEGGDGGEGSDGGVRKRRRKRRRDKRTFALDEEDYELLEDNQVTGVRRPEEQRKRLKPTARTKAAGAKQLRDELFGGEGDLEDEDLADLGAGDEGRGGGRDRGGGGDDWGREERGGRHHDRYEGDDFAGEGSDEMGDFIVGGEDVDKRRARRDARVAQAAGLSTQAVQMANRMFGNFGELLDLHSSHQLYGAAAGGAGGAAGDATEEEEVLEEDDEMQEEEFNDGRDAREAERRRLERQEKMAAKKQQRLLQHVDPELVDTHFLRPHDHTIRATDLPERLQLLGKPILESLNETDKQQLLVEASRWVVDHLFGARSQRSKVRNAVEDGVLEVTGKYSGPYLQARPTDTEEFCWPPVALAGVKDEWLDLRNNRAVLESRERRLPSDHLHHRSSETLLEKWRNEVGSQEQLRQNVQSVLADIFDKGEEVPVVAMFRKEDCGDLLAVRGADTPDTTGNDKTDKTEYIQEVLAPGERPRFPTGTMQAKHRRIRRWDVLWAVYNSAVRFFDMYRRRQQRLESYSKVFDQSENDYERNGISACFSMVQAVSGAADMDDVDVKFRHTVEMASGLEGLPAAANGAGAAAAGANGQSAGEQQTHNGRSGVQIVKRPGRANVLKRYVQRGLWGCAQEVFLPMQLFSENVQKQVLDNAPPDPDSVPEEWADDQIRSMGLDEESEQARYADIANPPGFLRALKEIVATDLSAEPVLRALIRQHVFSSATVSTKPTAAGADVLDPFHPYGITKHLQDKTISSFESTDTWLRILAAEKAGLIRVELHLTGQQDPLEKLGEMYLSENLSDAAQGWNEWRKGVMHYAVNDKIVPALLQELRTHLTAMAIDTTLTQVQDAFWRFVSQPPVRITEAQDENDTSDPAVLENPRFMAVVWGAGAQGDGPTTIVQLDGNGNLKDLMTAAQLSGNVPRTVNSSKDREKPTFDPALDPKKSKDSHKIREKILEHKPNAILVSTNAPQSKQIKDDMEKISQYTMSDPRFRNEVLPDLENKKVDVFWSDHRLAALWANSDAAKAEFPDYSYQVRMAVGVGRLALDPLAILSVLCGPKKGILSLKMHDLQEMLPREALAQRLEQTLITAVSQVGVDINAIVANPWRQGPLQFVPGLGPRKARALLAAIAASEDPFVKTRTDLLKQDAESSFGGAGDMALLGRVVFQNAASCLRVRHGAVSALQNEADFDAVDDIRIHPQSEAMLQIILDEAFDPENQGITADVRTAIESSQTMLALDLYAVAEHNNYVHKLLTLSDMVFELLAPYGEVRLGAATPSDEEAFYLRHGETPDSLKVGRLVEGKVVWVGQSEVKVVLQNNGMEAFIPQDQVSSSNPAINLGEVFQHGQAVTARILQINIADKNALSDREQHEEGRGYKFDVTLSTTSTVLQDFETWEEKYCAKTDTAYKLGAAAADKAAGGDKAAAAGAGGNATPSRRVPSARRPQLQPRPIEHPLWRNKRGTEVATELENKPPGSVLFRPAMKPTAAERLSHISASIKLADLQTGPLILNVDIKERKDKPAKQARLAPPLRVELTPKEEEQYDDLDEIVARYVEPLVENVTLLRNHRKFAEGDPTNVSKHIRQQLSQQAAGNAGAYCVAIDAARPGTGYIAYGAGGPESSIYKEWFNITPNGYFFRQTNYSEVEKVLDAFKRDPNYKKKQRAADMTTQQQRMGQPAPAGYGQATPYGQAAGGYGAGGGYTPHHQMQPQHAGGAYGGGYGGGYVGAGQQPGGGYRQPAPAAAAAAGYGMPPQPQGGYPGMMQQAPPGYAPAGYAPAGPAAGGYNPAAASGYQQPPPYHYGQAR